MKFNRNAPADRNASPSRRKKISMPGTMKTPLGPSLMRCSSTKRSSSGTRSSVPAVTIRTGPASVSSFFAFRLISWRALAGSASR